MSVCVDLVSVCDRVEISYSTVQYSLYCLCRKFLLYKISTRSQTDFTVRSTLTDTRSDNRETDNMNRTDTCQAMLTDRSPPVSLTTPDATGSSAPAPSSLPPPNGATPTPSPASAAPDPPVAWLECSSCTRVSPTYYRSTASGASGVCPSGACTTGE